MKKPISVFRPALILVFILLIAFTVRLYRISTPLADWHSFRQADTASVAREYVKNGIDLLHPQYHDLSDIQSGIDNLDGWRMVEFPIINGGVAFLYKLLPHKVVELHVFYRLTSIIFSLASIVYLYKLIKLLEDKPTALLSSLVFALLPYNIFYSRSIFPEIPLVFFMLVEFYCLAKYFRAKNHSLKNPYFWVALVSGAIALLLKPSAIFIALPILVDGFLVRGKKLFTDWRVYFYSVLVVLPLIAWRLWITQFPSGIPAFDWLLNGNGIRFTPAFFRWIFAERLSKLILGYWGLIPFALGLIAPTLSKKKSGGVIVFYSWLLAMFIYISVIATGNVQHDYYQIITIPIISIFVARGLLFLYRAPIKYSFNKIACYLLLVTCFLFMLAFSWYQVKDYYHINNWAIVTAGKAVNQHTPPNSLVIAHYMGDTAFLYQTNRRGWPIGFNIDQRIDQGAQYYVSTEYNYEAKELESKYSVLEKTKDFILIDLTR